MSNASYCEEWFIERPRIIRSQQLTLLLSIYIMHHKLKAGSLISEENNRAGECTAISESNGRAKL